MIQKTGKTHTLIEIIRQLVAENLKVLVCGPSNISVDNIADKLAAYRIPMVRVGHPARVLPTVLSSSLDYVIQTSDAGMLVKDIRKEMDEKLADVKKARNAGDRRRTWEDIRGLRKECKEREIRCTREIMGTSKVVLSTLHGAGGRDVLGQKFDVIIIDEAGQALEAQCWIAMLNATKCILAGDHLQLGPTVPRSEKDEFKELELSLFERLIKLQGSKIKKSLSVQYRMHQTIMDYPSNSLYGASLIAAESVQNHLLSDLPDVEATEDTKEPLVFWDTQGGDFRERVPDETDASSKRSFQEESKSNPTEASLCGLHVRSLIKAGVRPSDIAVITPYNAQVTLLSETLKSDFPDIEIGSVDGFQGREKEAIVLSLVRSNEKHEVGFLSDERRLNVAMTRPRRHLCVIGDSETVSRGSKYLKAWMVFLEENSDLRYPDPSTLQS
ncbi:hypothetical protein ABW21_db0202801 [Orbilia brochopaga]|nr:hypothetical protein ABW21_db0202801 [Drechslerella brochopaga]